VADEKAKEVLNAMASKLVLGIDAATGGDYGSVAAMMFHGDGRVEIIGHKELYADPVPPFDLDLKAQDVTDQKALPKPGTDK
jgi:hypothetical protein